MSLGCQGGSLGLELHYLGAKEAENPGHHQDLLITTWEVIRIPGGPAGLH